MQTRTRVKEPSICAFAADLPHRLSGLRGGRLGVGQHQRRMMIIKELCSGRLEADQGVKDSLNTCTTCGLCTENCPAGISPPDIIERARGMLVALGLTTFESWRILTGRS